MEQKNDHIPSSSCAGNEAGGFKKTDDSAQAEEEELNEENSESSSKNQGVQTSITEEQTTADEKSSKDDAQEKLPDQSVGKLSSSSSFYSHHDCNKLLESNRSSPVCSIKNKGEIVEKKDRIIPKRAVGHYQDIRRSVPLPQTLAISTSVWVPPCSESTAKTLQGTSTAEKQTGQAFPIKLTQPEPLSRFKYSSITGEFSKSPYKKRFESLLKEHVLHKRRRSLEEFGASERFSPTFVNPRSYSNPTTFSINPSDSGRLYPPHNRNLKNSTKEISVQSQSDHGGDHRPVEKMRPPVTAEHNSRRKTPAAKQQSYMSSANPVMSPERLAGAPSRIYRDNPPSFPIYPSHSPWSVLLPHPLLINKTSEKQTGADKETSKEDAQIELQGQNLSSFPPVSFHPSTSSSYSRHDYDSCGKPSQCGQGLFQLQPTRVPQGSATGSSVWVPPCSESTAKSLQETSTAEKPTEQAFPIKLTQPDPLSHSDSDLEFQYSSEIDRYAKSSYEKFFESLLKELEEPEHVLPKQRRSLEEFGASERFSPAFVNPRSHSNPTTFSINPSDSGHLYPPHNRNLKNSTKEIPVQSQSDHGGDHRPVEKMRPPVTAEHNSRRKTPAAKQLSYMSSANPVMSPERLAGAPSRIYRDNPPSFPIYPSHSPWSVLLPHPLLINKTSEKQTGADKETSKEDAQIELQGQNLSSFPPVSFHPSTSSSYSRHDYDSWGKPSQCGQGLFQLRPTRVPQGSATGSSVWVPPCSESTAKSLQETSTAEKPTEQAFPIKLTQPDPLSHSDSDLEFQYSSEIDRYAKSSYEKFFESLLKELEEPEHVLPKQRRSLEEFGASERFSPAFVNPRSHSNPTTFSINPSDSGHLYPPHNRNLKNSTKEIPVQSQSDHGGDHRPVEKMRPPVTAEHNLRGKTPAAKQQSYMSSANPVMSPERLAAPWEDFRPDMTTDPDHDTYDAGSRIYRDNPPSFPVYRSRILPHQSPVPSAPLWSTFIPEPLQGNSSASFTKTGALIETGTILKPLSAAGVSPGVSQENIRETEHVTAGPSTLQLSTSEDDDSDSDEYYDDKKERDEMSGSKYNASHPCFNRETEPSEYEKPLLSNLSLDYDPTLHLPNIINNACVSPRDSVYTSGVLTFSQSNIPAAIGCLSQGDSHTALQDSPVCTKISRKDAFDWSEEESEGDCGAQVEMEASVSAVNLSITNTLPTCSHLQSSSDPDGSSRDSSCLPRSHSVPSLSPTSSAENKTFTQAQSLPDMLLKNNFEEFTPDIIADGSDESYRFQCSCPGLYQCSMTGLVFHMEGGGDVVYRTVPWNRRLLAQHHKQPAGPLFDIKCLQQSVSELHLPHCEICSTGGCHFLSVAHESNAGIEFISPCEITETHVVINITGFSAFGNVKDEDAPPVPVRALVLLFYRPPAAPDPTSLLNVLMLPKNVVLQDVKNKRKKLVGDENYIEMSPHCKLHPQQEYTLSTCPEDDSVLVQPKVTEFECDNYDNYFPSFQVDLEKILKHIHLFLRDANNQDKQTSVWERRVCLSSTGVKRPRVQGSSADRLKEIRSSFIDGVSGPVLKNLLDKLLEKNVLIDSERESVDSIQDRSDKARCVIDTVRKKGEAASSEMIEFLCEVDHILCEHLGLI